MTATMDCLPNPHLTALAQVWRAQTPTWTKTTADFESGMVDNKLAVVTQAPAFEGNRRQRRAQAAKARGK